jgi:DNA (cytosine-5)-methyltransferase 1
MVGFKKNNLFSFDQVNIPSESPRLRTILHSENETFSEKYTLSDKLWNYLKEYAKKHKEKGNGFGFGLVGPDDVARTLSARYYKDGSEILIKQSGKNPRRLTPVECARLMGFDSVLTENSPDKPRGCRFKIPVSDTQAYKQFGNSVVVPVVRAIAEQMLTYIMK